MSPSGTAVKQPLMGMAAVAFHRQFRSYGLQPGGVDGSWVQPVPLVRAQLDGAATATLSLKGGKRTLANGEDVTLQSLQPRARVQIKDAPLVYRRSEGLHRRPGNQKVQASRQDGKPQ